MSFAVGQRQPPPQLMLLLDATNNVAVLFLLLLSLQLQPTTCSPSGRPEVVVSSHGAVATDDGRCSRVSRYVLRDGGGAVDAAVAAALCLGVVSPASSGIGGGGFMLVTPPGRAPPQAFDMRETAPLKASKDMYAGNATLKARGALSIAVPGELAGLHEAWKQHGKLPWKRLVEPAIRFAHGGFRISPYLHHQMASTETGILSSKGLREIFAPNGTLLKIGDICYNKKLAKTLESISTNGPEVLYNGTIGAKLIGDVQKAGGILSMEDLKSYKVKVKKPISANVMGLEVLGMPPPSSGGAGIVLISNILSLYGFPSGVAGSLGLHRLIESLKHYFAVRMNLGDPDFVDVTKVISDMLSIKLARDLKKTILDNMTLPLNQYGGRWNQIQDHGTGHFCIVDGERSAVSMTSTVNYYFGSLVLSPSTGILLNNEMDDFSIPLNSTSATTTPPAPVNFIHPLKRPLSSMAPTIILKDSQLQAVVGASGGAMIVAATTEVILNHFIKKMDPFSSIMAPRLYHQLIPNVVMYENWTTVTGDHFEVSAKVRIDLERKGHVLQGLAGGTICQFIVHDLKNCEFRRGVSFGNLTAISDPRKGGLPAGY